MQRALGIQHANHSAPHRRRAPRVGVLDSVFVASQGVLVAEVGRRLGVGEGLGAARVALLDAGEAGPVDAVGRPRGDGVVLAVLGRCVDMCTGRRRSKGNKASGPLRQR